MADPLIKQFVTVALIPQLREAVLARSPTARSSTAQIWHAAPYCAGTLARALVAANPDKAPRYVDSLLAQGASLDAMYTEVFEPAERQLGMMWESDEGDDFWLTIGLARLNLELRRMHTLLPAEHACKPHHRVLLCTQPLEPHSESLCMSSEIFHRRGWAVHCESCTEDQRLEDLVRTNWFDVLKVSQSAALRRGHRLASLRVTINLARAVSLNPALVVMVDGRTFLERPELYRSVNADAMGISATQSVLLAERLVAATRSVTPLREVSVC